MDRRPEGGRSPRQKRDRRRRIAAAVIALLVAIGMILPTVAVLLPPARGVATSPASAATPVSARVSADAPTDPLPGPVVVIGMSGVSWSDVTGATTPTLWELGTTASAANLVVRSQRSSSCPADGWLALSTGIRTADVPMEEYGSCRRLLVPAEGESVPGWADFTGAAEASDFAAHPGTLGETLAGAGVSARGIGGGAAIALADAEGVPVGAVAGLPDTTDQLRTRTRSALTDGTELLVVDVGSLRDANRPLVRVARTSAPDQLPSTDPAEDSVFADLARGTEDGGSLVDRFAQPSRESQLIAIDARVGAVLETVREQAPDATVIVASVADPGTTAGLRLLAASGPGFTGGGDGILRADSTRQTGLVQTFDIPATVLAALEVEPPAAMSGSIFATDATTREDAGVSQHRKILALADDARHAAVVPSIAPTYTLALIVLNLLVYAAATLGLNRRVHRAIGGVLPWAHARGRGQFHERGVRFSLRALRFVALAVAAVPVAPTLANLLPWWRAGDPGLAMLGVVTVIVILIALVALAGPWRRWLLGPLGVVAGITAVTFGIDVVTGATLQLANPMGTQPQVGARFYGLNNQSFALFATSMLLLATCLAEPLVRAGRRRAAALVVLGVGAVEVVVNGHPSLGADFGGPPATVPGFLVLALMTAGIRVTWRKVLVIGAAAAAVVATFAITDWLRPARERTHLGGFVQTVLDGGLWDVVSRKLSANLSLLFGTPLTFLAIGGLLVVLLILSQPLRRDHREAKEDGPAGTSSAYGWLTGGPSILRLDRAAVMLRPGILGIAVTLTIGFALNDSGIVIPALGLALMVPLLIAVLTTWLLRLRDVEASSGEGGEAAGVEESAGATASAGRGPRGDRVGPAPRSEDPQGSNAR